MYLAVLEEVYRRIRAIESDLNLDNLPPAQALQKLVEFTYDHHRDNEDFMRLVMNENIQRGDYLRQSQNIQALNTKAIASVKAVHDRGVAQGVFRPRLDPVAARRWAPTCCTSRFQPIWTFLVCPPPPPMGCTVRRS